MELVVDPELSRHAVKIFKALADSTRYEMVRMLVRKGEVRCTEFADAFPLSGPALSHHYRVLENAGLISARKEGLHITYLLNRDELNRYLPSFAEAHLTAG